MSERATGDGNQAAASVAYRLSEAIVIYPITPRSPMAELCDEWASRQKTNIWGVVPQIAEMQSEAGVAGAIHGALQAGALATTFTASQGLLLMIPNMYKIAGELTPFTMHVAARTLAHACAVDFLRPLGRDGVPSDGVRPPGIELAAGGTGHGRRRPRGEPFLARAFLHFLDGFRTSHELAKIEELSDDEVVGRHPLPCGPNHAGGRERATNGASMPGFGRPITKVRAEERRDSPS